MKKLLLLTALFLFIVPLALATTAYVIPTNTSTNSIYYDETASFTLTLSNPDAVEHVYSWSVNPLDWIVESKTAGKVPAESIKQFEIVIRPKPSNFKGPGSYVIPLNIESSDETLQEQITIFIKSINDRGNYAPSIALGASIGGYVDPREKLSTQVLIRNRNNRMIENLTLKLDGSYFSKTDIFSLSGLEEKSLEYRFDIDDLIKPGTYNYTAKLYFEDKIISQVQKYYDVVAYSTIDRKTSTTKNWFERTQITQLQNNGNIQKTVSTNLKIPFYKKLFTHISIAADHVELVTGSSWVIILAPSEKATVSLRQNYVALPIFVVLFLLLLISYFFFRNPIVLAKQIIVTGKDEEGISEMKVRIYIRNRTDKAFYNLRLLDKAPTIADVEGNNGLGVLEPTKIIKTEKRGTIIKWDFDSLEAYEERIVTYTIKSKLKIIGSLSLPKVRVKYETSKGKEKTAESGLSQIGTKN